MCSIIGIISNSLVASALVESLKRMEYRGYDSVGLATLSTNRISVRKGIGKVNQVNNNLNLAEMDGFVGIGHTRWATHGGITDYSAHTHSCCTNDIYDAMLEIPKMDNELLYPLVEIIPLQPFSYYLALQHNADPDFPRNLAKSVTLA